MNRRSLFLGVAAALAAPAVVRAESLMKVAALRADNRVGGTTINVNSIGTKKILTPQTGDVMLYSVADGWKLYRYDLDTGIVHQA